MSALDDLYRAQHRKMFEPVARPREIVLIAAAGTADATIAAIWEAFPNSDRSLLVGGILSLWTRLAFAEILHRVGSALVGARDTVAVIDIDDQRFQLRTHQNLDAAAARVSDLDQRRAEQQKGER